MKTPAGLDEEQKRWQFMQQFLDQLAQETGLKSFIW